MVYGQPYEVTEDVSATFHDAGHILGLAMLELDVNEEGMRRKIVFSGDIGQWDKPLIRDPSLLEEAGYIVMESTCGVPDHNDAGDVETQLGDVIDETVSQGGSVIIPTFAVERAQELMYHISALVNGKKILRVPIYLDSPMAVDVTDVFHNHRDSVYQETWDRIMLDEPPLGFSDSG